MFSEVKCQAQGFIDGNRHMIFGETLNSLAEMEQKELHKAGREMSG